jgi:hypothetical protein
MRPSSRDLPGLVYEKSCQKYRSPLLVSEDEMSGVAWMKPFDYPQDGLRGIQDAV